MSMEDSNSLYPNHEKLSFRSYQHIHVNESTDSKGVFPILGYTSDVGYIFFPPDEETMFHYPISGEDVNWFETGDLNRSGLVLDGAFWGDVPKRADKIYAKNDNYHFESVNGDYIPKQEDDWVKNGVWLCAWLSGSCCDDNPPVWIDRWYDPRNIMMEDAINAPSDSPFVKDVKSSIKLSPGLYCKYNRIGDKKIKNINDEINTDKMLLLGVDDWTAVLSGDEFVYSDITVDNFRNPDIGDISVFVNEACSFNGDGQFVYRKCSEEERLYDANNFSISTWVKFDDLSRYPVGGFIGSGFRSGWEIGLHNKPMMNIVLFVERWTDDPDYRGRVYVKNCKDELISHKNFSDGNDGIKIFGAVYDVNGYIWVVYEKKDEQNDDLIVSKCDITLVEMEKLVVCRGSDVVDATIWNSYGQYNKCIVRVEHTNLTEYYEVDKVVLSSTSVAGSKIINPITSAEVGVKVNGNGFYGLDGRQCFLWSGRFDSEDNDKICYIGDGTWIPQEDLGRVIDITCDWNNTYWALLKCDGDDCGFPSDKNAIVSYTFNNESKTYVRDRTILINGVSDMARLRMSIVQRNGEYDDVFYVVDQKTGVYFIIDEESGHEIKEFRLSDYGGFSSFDMTITSYEWQRTCCTKDKLYFKAYVDCVEGDQIKEKRMVLLAYDAKDILSDGRYHHVAVLNDGSGPMIVIDCKPVDAQHYLDVEDSDTQWMFYYTNKNGLMIGAKCGTVLDLGFEFNLTDVFSRAVIDDVRLFKKPLTVDDVRYIYMAKYHLIGFYWYFTSYNRYMLEEIEHFTRFKMPGSKSGHFEIHIKGFKEAPDKSVDDSVKKEIEDAIHGAIKMLTPAYTDIFRIVWDE